MMEGLEANGDNLQSSDWSAVNNDDMMYSTPQSSASTTMQYAPASPRMLQTFTTVQLPEGSFQLTSGGGFPQIYMNSATGNFERMSTSVEFQPSNITPVDNLSQVPTLGDNRQQISVPFMMTPSQTLPQLTAISSGSLGFGYTSLLQSLGVGIGTHIGTIQVPQPLPMASSNVVGSPVSTHDVRELPLTSVSNSGSMLSIGQYNGVVREARNTSSVYDQLQLAQCSADDTDLEQLLADADTDYNNHGNGQCPSEPDDLDSRYGQEENIVLRKSERIAQRERTPSPIQRPKYVSKPYTVFEIWCEDCQTSHVGECPTHKLQLVYDKLVQSRAWSSLPPQLQIFRLSETTINQPSELGVFAKRPIPKRVQFGPFIANLVLNPDNLTAKKFHLLVERENGITEYLDAVDENCCNWMMFVRPATSYAEQNMVAYQYGADIYFSTIKPVEARQELKVWYAAHYAERLGIPLHPVSLGDQKEMDDSELVWPCYECSERFRTEALLHKHLASHDEPSSGLTSTADNLGESNKRSCRKSRRRSSKISKQIGNSGKETVKPENLSEEDAERATSFQS